ncbi:hypothetical protein PAHAL_2G042300 [Panicum hallii]|uniref:Uncharacterized protein n=1 Tax=Panicum hallii TaxID=206008 RepID=A0A2T8KMU5_9POAL|nr:hypothetical protein PAHAL_2G042300 [Panicum hallii]
MRPRHSPLQFPARRPPLPLVLRRRSVVVNVGPYAEQRQVGLLRIQLFPSLLLAIDVNTHKSASFPFLQNPEAMAIAVLTFSSRPPPLRLVVERPCAAPRTRLASRRDPRQGNAALGRIEQHRVPLASSTSPARTGCTPLTSSTSSAAQGKSTVTCQSS